MTRAMATIRTITEIKQHPNADNLEIAVIDEWQCIVQKGVFQQAQVIVFCEIDSWIPHDIAPFLSRGKEPREYEGIKGERLRTIKLRGELSQGIVLPFTIVENQIMYRLTDDEIINDFGVGTDVSELLMIKKYEKPLPTSLAGKARGNFPEFIRKTDQERIQNILGCMTEDQKTDVYEVTLKMDGSSCTFYHNEGHVGVCSRNIDLKIEDNEGNAFVDMFNKLQIGDKLKALGRNIAIQGELYGHGINGNWEGISDIRYNVFDIFDIDTQSYLDANERYNITYDLNLNHVHVIGKGIKILHSCMDYFLDVADTQSLKNPIAEGVVYKSLTNPDFSFKVINNKYLLSGGN